MSLKQDRAKEFVLAWQAAGSVDEVAALLGRPRLKCIRNATFLRQRGVPLKMFNTGGNWKRDGKGSVPLNIDELVELCRKEPP